MPNRCSMLTRQVLCRYVVSVLPAVLLAAGAQAAPAPAWTGAGRFRVLVRVDPVPIEPRARDELVARYRIDFDRIRAGRNSPGRVDLATLQVHRYAPATGTAVPLPPFAGATSQFDCPCRFEDERLPEAYPARVGHASGFADGRARRVVRMRKGRLFNREMDAGRGSVIWTHGQEGAEPSFYAIYWDEVGLAEPVGPAPAPWIGDVDVCRLRTGGPLGGPAHLTVAVGDLNGDGLFDLVAGAEKGDLFYYPNRGRRGQPKFVGCRMLMDADGPIDVGWYSAPLVYDWDDDGLTDVLVGTGHNVILWWRRTGSGDDPALVYKGFIKADGRRLEVPQTPVPEDLSGAFKADYYNQPTVCDWNGDGLPDILTGGYTTGRIFYYRCTGRDASGVPKLAYVGPVEADGQPIDTGWAAAPSAADLTGDGRLELISGSWRFQGGHEPGRYLLYYTAADSAAGGLPRYTATAFPRAGAFPRGIIARASVVDWNDDGLQDLLVSENGGDMFVCLNVGTAAEPRWRMDGPPLTGSWCFARMPGFSALFDWDQDGRQELLAGNTIYAREGSAHSPRFVRRGTATVGGKPLFNPGPGYGDPYNRNIFWDWDRDGRVDILSGTQQGEIFLHRNMGAADNLSFAPGVPLALTDGRPLKVGPPVHADPKQVRNFTELQGSRTILVPGDFDQDGLDDLVVTETYRNVWLFRNTTAGGTATLRPGVKVLELPARLAGLAAVDWNNDGRLDLVTGLSAAQPVAVFLNESTPSKPAFSGPVLPVKLPYCFWGPTVHAVDWNSDGDRDLLIRSEFYGFWAERSFLEHGYCAAAQVGTVEQRPD